MKLSEAKKLTALLNKAIENAELQNVDEVNLILTGQKLDDAARADLQSAIDDVSGES